MRKLNLVQSCPSRKVRKQAVAAWLVILGAGWAAGPAAAEAPETPEVTEAPVAAVADRLEATAPVAPPADAPVDSEAGTDGDDADAFADVQAQAFAAPAAPRPTLSLYFENDGSFVRPNGATDRHYTSGEGFSVGWRGAGRGLVDRLGLPPETGTALGLVLAQQIFTPDNIGLPADPDDRSYAGYLYLGGFWQIQQDNVFDHVQLDLGVIGPSSLAELAQESVHDFFDEPDPDFSDQLDDEATVNLTLRRRWRLDVGSSQLGSRRLDWQLIPRVETDLGTVYRRVSAGALVRVGFNLPDDFGPARMLDLGSEINEPFGGRPSGISTYVFGQAVGRYVGFNAFLDGGRERDPDRTVDRIPWLGEFSAGFAVEWKRHNLSWRVAYTQTLTTREFEAQDGADTVGAIALRLIYEF